MLISRNLDSITSGCSIQREKFEHFLVTVKSFGVNGFLPYVNVVLILPF